MPVQMVVGGMSEQVAGKTAVREACSKAQQVGLMNGRWADRDLDRMTMQDSERGAAGRSVHGVGRG